jgi:hypothetical protein
LGGFARYFQIIPDNLKKRGNMNSVLKSALSALFTTLAVSAVAHAATAPVVTHVAPTVLHVWKVSDAVSTHGLYTGDQTFHNDNSFHFGSDARLTELSDGTAKLTGSAADSGVNWQFNVLFGGFSRVSDGAVKTGGGPKLNSWEYYYQVGGGLSNSLGNSFTVARFGPALQIGLGANDKTSAFGGSAWLENYDSRGNNLSGHWDLNFNLQAAPVPEPETYAMMGLGLAGLGLMVRRKKASTAQ